MFADGICQVSKNFFSKTVQFYDINYQLALNEDKTTIFENYCDFLNYFDSSISVQLSFINQQVDVAEFEVREAVYDMMTWWCEKGIDGFRMDVINMISKDQSFPDGPVDDGLYGNHQPFVCDGPRVHEYLKEMNQKVLQKYDIMTVGEALNTKIDHAMQYAGEDTNELNMVFHFEHVSLGETIVGKWTNKKVPLRELKDTLNKWQIEFEGKAWNSLYLDNHDQPRAVSRFGNDSPMFRAVSAKMLATCLHMMKGTPYVFQGEELGMTNAYYDNLEDYRDIETINAFHELTENGLVTEEEMMECIKNIGRDNARTPMQWDKSPNAGFTTGTPWLKVNPNYMLINAEDERKDPNSVFHYYKKLIALRKEYEIIVYGKFGSLLDESEEIYAYERTLGNQRMIVACNFTDKEVACDLFENTEDGKELISNYKQHKDGLLRPYEARVVLLAQ